MSVVESVHLCADRSGDRKGKTGTVIPHSGCYGLQGSSVKDKYYTTIEYIILIRGRFVTSNEKLVIKVILQSTHLQELPNGEFQSCTSKQGDSVRQGVFILRNTAFTPVAGPATTLV